MTLHHTILFWIFLFIGVVFSFCGIAFLIAIERSSNFFEFFKHIFVFLVDIGIVAFFFFTAYKFERMGIFYGEKFMAKLEAKTGTEKQGDLLDPFIDADLRSSKENVSGILSGDELKQMDKDGDGKIAIHEFYPLTEKEVLEKILKEDSGFSKSSFNTWTRMIFQTLLKAVSMKDYSLLRSFEEDSLYIQHKQKIEQYIKRGETWKFNRLVIKGTLLKDYRIEGNQQILVVALSANMIDYLLDQYGDVLQGNTYQRVRKQYLLTFVRNVGVKTTKHSNHMTTTCPNCGASVKFLENGVCSYCGSVVTTGKYSWVLLSIKDIKIIGEHE